MFTDINKRLRIRFFYFIAEIPDSQVKSSIRFGRPPRKQDNHNPQSIFGRSKLKSNFARPGFQGLRNLRVNVITLEQYQLFMPYEYVEFDINPPIGEAIGKVPEHIKPIYENGAITKLQVILGEERTETIKKSNHFKKISNGISGIDFVNLLEQEIRDYATQRAKDFINQVNFKLDSPRYKVQLTTLAVLQLQRYLSISTGAYIIDFNSKTDIFEIEDEDNFCSRIVDYYLNGLNARENGDLVSAYRYFYLVIPENRGITSDRKLNRDLKILRHGASHSVLNDQKLMDRAKELLGDEYVKRDSNSERYYAYVDITTPGHIDLFKTYIPIIKKSARDYIDRYMKSHIK